MTIGAQILEVPRLARPRHLSKASWNGIGLNRLCRPLGNGSHTASKDSFPSPHELAAMNESLKIPTSQYMIQYFKSRDVLLVSQPA